MNTDSFDENTMVAAEPSGLKSVPMEAPKLGADGANKRRALRDISDLMRPVSVPAPCPPAITKAKKGIPDKKKDDENKIAPSAVPPHRPITRGFAANLKSQAENLNLNLPFSGSDALEVSYDADVDDSRKHVTEPSVNEEMEEVTVVKEEMEEVMTDSTEDQMEAEVEDLEEEENDYDDDESDYLEELIVQEEDDEVILEAQVQIAAMDMPDRNNPLAVVDYVEDIYAFYGQTEVQSCVSPNYMSIQTDINQKMRGILIDWLIEVHHKFDMMGETLFLMVNIIDRFLAIHTLACRDKLQLVGVTAMLLACKYEEITFPIVKDLIVISDGVYTGEDVLEMERLIANTLQFNFGVPTAYVFMRRFLKAANSDSRLEHLGFFLIELCLVEYNMLNFRPSMLAAAAVYTAVCALRGANQWTNTCIAHTGYMEEQLQECARMMVNFHLRAGSGRLTAVHNKYRTLKYGFAAEFQPAVILLELQVSLHYPREE